MMIEVGRRISYMTLLLILVPAVIHAQESELGSWWELKLEKGFDSGIGLRGEAEQRFGQDGFQFERTLFTLAGDRDLGDHMNLETGSRIFFTRDPERSLNTWYRHHLDLAGRWDISRLRLLVRGRIQYIIGDWTQFADLEENKLTTRQRFRVRYHPFGTRLEISASLESWFRHGDGAGIEFWQIRYAGDLLYHLNFRSSLTFGYILEDEYNRNNPGRRHIVVFGYAYRI